MKKLLKGGLAAAVMISLISNGRVEIILLPKVLIIFVIGLIASYFQADYNPFSFNNGSADRGTIQHLIWTVYLTQMMAFYESIHFSHLQTQSLDIRSFIFLAIAVFGLFYRSWAYLTLGQFFTMHLEIQQDHQLITTGPYRYLRHPSYLGAYLTYVFLPLFLEAYISAAFATVFLGWAFYRRVEHEETMLRTEFGPLYDKYSLNRKKLIPGIW